MVTKTLTIMEDAYNLLLNHKHIDESFSEEIRRLFANKKKRSLTEFFGILSNEEGKIMLKDLEKSREIDMGIERIK